MSHEISTLPNQPQVSLENREPQPPLDEAAELYARYREQQRRLHCPSCGESAECF